MGIAEFFKNTLSSGLLTKKNAVDIYETPYDNLHVVTATAELADLQPKLEAKHKINKLRKLLDELDEDYDRIYIDTPPALNFYAVSALIAADRVLIPFDCDSFSRQALYGLLKEIEELKEDHNEGLAVEGIVVNQFQANARLPQQMLDELIAEGLPVIPVYLASSVKMRESHEQHKPLIHLDPRHKLSQQFVELHHLLDV
jgi:chromosome partitioning protein